MPTSPGWLRAPLIGLKTSSVTIGYKSREYVEITGGLEEGDIVVMSADYAGISDGAKVRYSEIEEYKEAK
jgi:hypothetical protein